ncbi:MAG: hypothetical protein IPN01_09590 [Deltaproteobacteria bacterium]|nr:hypothetical protein [Deltaproteobacteria bacterium]
MTALPGWLGRLESLTRPAKMAIFAAVLAAPTLLLGFITDDLMMVMAVEERLGRLTEAEAAQIPVHAATEPLFGVPNVFTFFNGDADEQRQLRAEGERPWWSAPDLRLSFWRPLSSLLWLLDVSLFGRAPLGYHLHSLAWNSALIVAATLLLRKSLGSVGPLAAALYLLDDNRWMAVGWLSNRNAIVALSLGLFGLLAHLRWREDGWRAGAPLSLLLFAASLAAGEFGLGALVFLGSYELLGAPGRPVERARALAPALILGLLWAAFYQAKGYGASGSLVYIDPAREPGMFFTAAAERLPILLGTALGPIPGEVTTAAPQLALPAAALGSVLTLSLALGLRRVWHRLDDADRRGLGWLLPGGLLATAPVLATLPMGRLCLAMGLGAAAALGALAVGAAAAWGEGRRGWGLVLLGILGVHVAMPPGLWLGMPLLFSQVDGVTDTLWTRSFEGEDLQDQDVLVVTSSDLAVGMYLPWWAQLHRRGAPRRWLVGSPARADHVLSRPDVDTLRLDVVGEGIYDGMFAELLGHAGSGPQAGDTLSHGPLQISLSEPGPAGPRRIDLSVSEPWEESPLRVMVWRDGALVPLALPAVGESMVLPWSPGLSGM